jgi:hypothetical protein
MNRNYQKSINALSDGYEGRRNPEYYEGRVPNRYSGGFNYDGDAEDVTFADEAQLAQNLTFAFTIDNSVGMPDKAKDFVLALCPGYYATERLMHDNNNTPVDAVIREGSVASVLDAQFALGVKSQNKPIDELIAFTRFNPMRFVGLKMQCSNPDQFYQAINIKQLSPFRNLNELTGWQWSQIYTGRIVCVFILIWIFHKQFKTDLK